MRVLFDVVHPAHAHFYRHLIAELEAAGHATAVVARDKDVTTALLDRFGVPYTTVPRARRPGLAPMAFELARRDRALVREARRFRPDVIMTRNPAGVQAARLARVTGVFDTDDGSAVGIHYRAAVPFAHHVTSPDCLRERFGAKHVTYPSFKPLAFLHPDRFVPDPGVRAELGLGVGERYSVVRLVALAASHDRGEVGMTPATVREVVSLLERRGRVFLTGEGGLPPGLAEYALPVTPDRLHDVLAGAAVCVTDGQSMAGEAAVLGVPGVRLSSSSGRLDVFRELSERYGLVSEFSPGEEDKFLRHVEDVVDADPSRWQERRQRLLSETCDLTTWMLDFLGRIAP